MWAYVENDSVIEEHITLPKNWRNYSNFFTLESDLVFLHSIGWYNLFDNTVPISNDFLEYHGAEEYVINHETKTVVKNRPVLNKDNPPSAEQLHHQAREAFMIQLRRQRNYLLRESDWTQAADVQSSRSEDWKQACIEYRQWLRDLPEIYSQPPYDSVVNINDVEWRELAS